MKAIPGSMALDPVSQKTSTTQFHQSEEILELEVIGAGCVYTRLCTHASFGYASSEQWQSEEI